MHAVELQGISKRYNIYERPIDRLKELALRNRKCFHREYWSLRDVSLNVVAGKTTAIIGPNGSGKSTMLQIIAGVLQPTFGTINVHGRVTAILELGAGFQHDYTGRENVMLNGMILGISKDEMLERMSSIAEFAEIGDFIDQPVKTYSSGMIVRLAFAVAITVDPEILLIDEALAVGDTAFQRKCFAKIDAIQRSGKTIIFVTHDMNAVTDYCHNAVLLNGGKVVSHGDVNDIVPQYKELMSPNNHDVALKVFTGPSQAATPAST